MKTVRFSIIKLLSDFISQLISSAIIISVVYFIFSSEMFNKPINYIVFFILSFTVLMMLIYAFYIFAFPTVISVGFDFDRLIFKYIEGYGEKAVFYKDMKWIKKVGLFGDRYKIGINDDNIPLFLGLFRKNDRVDIIETIKNKAAA